MKPAKGSSQYSYINFNENFNVTCLLNVPYILVKYHKKYFKKLLELLPTQDLNNQGRKLQNGVILECDMPTQCPLHIGKVS